MGRTKKEKFSAGQNTFAAYNLCLSCSSRVAILEYLLSRKKVNALQVIDAIDLHHCTVRKHLEELVKTGFAKTQIYRGVKFYSANTEQFEKWDEMVGDLRIKFRGLPKEEAGTALNPNYQPPKTWQDVMRDVFSPEEIEQFGLGGVNRE